MITQLSRLTTLTAAAILLGTSAGALAQTTDQDHEAHHPEGTAATEAATPPQAGVDPGMMGPGMMGPGMMGPGMMGPGMMGPGMMGPGMMGPGMMQRMPEGMMGPGMMGRGMGPMGGMHGLGAIGMLELSEEQHAAIRGIHSELRRQHWDTLGRLMDERETLRDLYAAEPRDPAAIGAAHERLFSLKRPLIEAMVEAGNRIESLLTEEQQDQLKQLRRRGRGPMGGMDMMGPMGMGD